MPTNLWIAARLVRVLLVASFFSRCSSFTPLASSLGIPALCSSQVPARVPTRRGGFPRSCSVRPWWGGTHRDVQGRATRGISLGETPTPSKGLWRDGLEIDDASPASDVLPISRIGAYVHCSLGRDRCAQGGRGQPWFLDPVLQLRISSKKECTSLQAPRIHLQTGLLRPGSYISMGVAVSVSFLLCFITLEPRVE